MQFTEILPKLAQVNDKFTMIRSMSYTPIGLFNHTAAIYQLHTGYTADKVSPSGQLEPPSPADYPTMGSNIIRLKPPEVPMLPFVMMPRPLQESNVIGKGGTAGFLGRAYDPYTLFPAGDDMDLAKMDRLNIDDLKLRTEISTARLERRARLRDVINAGMPALDQAVSKSAINEYYGKALGLVLSGRARDAFDLNKETPGTARAVWPQHVRPKLPSGAPAGRSRNAVRRSHLAEGRQLRQSFVGPPCRAVDAHEDPVGPHARRGLSSLIADLDERGMLEGHAGRGAGRIRPQPDPRREHVGQLEPGRRSRPLAVLLHGRHRRRRSAARRRVRQVGQDRFGPGREPACIPIQLVATIYHSVGLDPATIIYNHLNQPREMVQADVVDGLLA